MKPNNKKTIKILFLADTHLGFDLPTRPRIERRRRGVDFFKNYHLALQLAFDKKVDLVIHGGDLFFRSRVHPKIVNDAFKPLLQIADKGIPIYLVPGNHERSNIPRSLLETHRLIHIFDKPRTFYFTKDKITVALVGFPYYKNGIRHDFQKVIDQTEHEEKEAEIKLLCMHHIVEGAQVGIQNYTFRTGDDVIQGKDIPKDFLAVLSGHIHRWQVLSRDLAGRLLAAPVLYPGAIERTSFVEREEKKGFFIIEVGFFKNLNHVNIRWAFQELPTRPMYLIEMDIDELDSNNVKSILKNKISKLNANGVVKVNLKGSFNLDIYPQINVEWLRSITPKTMNVDFMII
jgi:exonuclease SbcD